MRRYLTTILLALGLCAPAALPVRVAAAPAPLVQAAGLVEIALAGSVFSYSDVAFVGATASDPQAALDAYIASLSPTLWIEARKETAYADTDAVPTATDWSGNGYDATQGTASAQPTYVADGIGGLPTFSFDGGDYLESTGWTNAQPNTIIAIAQLTAAAVSDSSFHSIYDGIAPTRHALSKKDSVPKVWKLYAGVSLNSGTVADSANHIFVTQWNSGVGSSYLRLDGTQIALGNAGSSTLTGLTIGSDVGAGYWIGSISKIVCFEDPLSVSEIQQLETLSGAVYNITITH